MRGSDTSYDAAKSIAGGAEAMRVKCLEVIRQNGSATCDEVETQLDGRHQTISARVRELVQLGFIYDTGERRKTRSGRSARVYKAVEL